MEVTMTSSPSLPTKKGYGHGYPPTIQIREGKGDHDLIPFPALARGRYGHGHPPPFQIKEDRYDHDIMDGAVKS